MSEERFVDVGDLLSIIDELVDFVANGGRVLIMRDGEPIVRMLPPLED